MCLFLLPSPHQAFAVIILREPVINFFLDFMSPDVLEIVWLVAIIKELFCASDGFTNKYLAINPSQPFHITLIKWGHILSTCSLV